MEPDRKAIKQYFWSNDFRLAQINDDNTLMTLYYENRKKSPKHKDKSEWTAEEKHIESYLKKQNKKFLTRAEVDGWTDIEISNSPSPKPTNWTLIISLGLIVAILLVGLIIFLKKRKRKL
ncbi:MAG: LPXTG cell wall anchor domain-containing protein [Candidatus Moeniiplasma glomeromycotorum]|nr:LPXTG cell wall anchor domain-containing protein [Candidatus Moeniiplasma glomeromycotorum]MCE8162593.1 LPXTG cell wall anchor domain-containing protein [Candidatus Moeniiplasma glomeromycotorum]MCE8166483.1 LPXTG cell wall anchor domain-containing protein [Candidatus Moeniiplasma glomeromycotorum]MCE8166976.1 LPXTG cell wall anchor domain-containing protein [Candidatus Moeniiplasma glomeromycotorum]